MAAPVPGSLLRQGTQSVDTDSDGEPVSLYYEVHKLDSSSTAPSTASSAPQGTGSSGHHAEPLRLVLIMGFAAASAAWRPLLLQLQHLWAHQEGPHVELLLMDNRGVGNSSSPKRKTDYSTVHMARDVLSLMDFVGWQRAHVVGFSMGGMIATKLAVEAIERCQTVTLIGVSQGGWDVLPRSWRAFKIGIRAAMATSAEKRAGCDLKMHYTRETLKQVVPKHNVTVRDLLLAEYVAVSRSGRPQPEWGFHGQMAACWNHAVTKADVQTIKQGKAPVWLIHGRQDLVAPPHLAEALASRLGAPCVRVDGAHFIPRENAIEVALLMQSIMTSGFPPARLASARMRTQLEGLALELDSLHITTTTTTTTTGTPVHVDASAGAAAASMVAMSKAVQHHQAHLQQQQRDAAAAAADKAHVVGNGGSGGDVRQQPYRIGTGAAVAVA